MNIVVKSALVSAALALSYACATPVEIDDVQVVDPNVFGDGGLLGGAGGGTGQGGASQGGTGAGIGGSASGAGGSPSGIAGTPVGSSGAGSLPGGAGTGGGTAGVGGASVGGSGGAAGAAAGAGGTAGSAGTAGTGGSGSSAVFDPSSCDFVNPAGCEDLTCQGACLTGDGGDCVNRCTPIVTCVSNNVAANPAAPCVTEADPMCGARSNGGTSNVCTNAVDQGGGPNPAAPAPGARPEPSFVARQFIECICSVPRP